MLCAVASQVVNSTKRTGQAQKSGTLSSRLGKQQRVLERASEVSKRQWSEKKGSATTSV